MENLKKTYTTLNPKQKDEFLWQVLVRHPDIRNQLIEYFATPEDAEIPSLEEIFSEIEDTCKEVIEELEGIDYEEVDWEDYTPPHSGYVPEWEAFDSIIIEKVDEIFEFQMPDVVSPISNGNIIGGVCILLGMYEACRDAKANGCNTFDDPNEEYIEYWKKDFYTTAIDAFNMSTTNPNHVKQIFQAIFERYKDEIETLSEIEGSDWIEKLPIKSKSHAEDRKQSADNDSWLEGEKRVGKRWCFVCLPTVIGVGLGVRGLGYFQGAAGRIS